MIGGQNFFLLCFGIAALWNQDTVFATLLTLVLRAAAAIVSVFDNIFTAAMTALIYHQFRDHLPSLSLVT
jgi:hypothetical protein